MSDHAISVKNITKKFGDLTAVDDISFGVPAGSIFAFLGPNGAGKTTTIKMLTTLLHPTSGTLELNGMDPVKHPHDVRKSFGIVFQDPSLDDELTAYENMFFHAGLYGLPRAETPKKIEDLMKFVELWDRRDSLVKTFSGGMKRRLEIARGLLHTPAILFLDEPTTGLDPQTRNYIWTYLKKLNEERGLTIFFTTHYMEEVERIAKEVVIVDHGKIVANDTPVNIVAKNGSVSLEDAFISLTGRVIREEDASGIDHLRTMARRWGRR
ncbi:ATP-binding cassette domain-containing protein [Patescibacteria group bacterium]|nr:ATP-binding cassette domain-containing protein [Patescibacteria group bacterium]MDE1946287.1 ATP-binding cassette domain-containing protein [Patescibacteria group bacterium]MDE2010739.1 ATP-binding cassette domain-containing protein [Patescibacteria group bacterium]MDE2232623.1 ATP-binding cassette domain-containing protein [Patescibacteria group bacterium]